MSTVALSSGLGALPARFRRERLLIVGCGDVGMRVARNYAQGAGGKMATAAKEMMWSRVKNNASMTV